MNKKYLHHIWTRVRPIKVWYLAIIFIFFATTSALLLRHNNLTMVQLRQEVYTADEKNGDVEGALQRLRTYVHSHMNTKLAIGSEAVYPPIQLKYTFQRLQEAEKARVQQANSAVYTNAQEFCEQQNATDFSGRNRIPCIEKYVGEHPVKEQTIPDALYKFDFYSPRWSPDFAGFSLAFTILTFIALLLRFAAGRLAKRLS